MLSKRVEDRWTEFWMRHAGLSRSGRLATRLATLFAPPYRARSYLRHLNPQGYISPKATIYHSKLQLGADIFIGDSALIFEEEGAGLVQLGDGVSLWGDCLLENGQGGTITIGARSRVNRGVQLVSYLEGIHIGADVGLSTNALLYNYNHGVAAGPYMQQPLETKGPIIIEDHAWIGMGSIILSGVRIGKHAVVAAGSLVIKDVPENAIAFGVPARVVSTRS